MFDITYFTRDGSTWTSTFYGETEEDAKANSGLDEADIIKVEEV